MSVSFEAIKNEILNQMPVIIEQDPAFCAALARALRGEFMNRTEAESRFEMMLRELREDREEQKKKWDAWNRKWDEAKVEDKRKWDEQNRKWDEQNQKWDEWNRKWDEAKVEDKRKRDEQNRKWDEQNRKWDEAKAEDKRKWDEQNRKWDEQNQKWDEQNRKWDEWNRKWDEAKVEDKRKWDEQNRKWEANQLELKRLHEEVMGVNNKIDRTIGALGARWGMNSERSFRNALAGILEKNFDVQVFTITEYDETGEVFGRPDQVELDLIVKNGLLLICELKSSVDKAAMYIFERKVRFYEKLHNKKANRMIVVSPMIDPRAVEVGKKLGVEMYSDSMEVSC
ncbi:MAG: DUF3782 domain-containing protein [Thermodesulfobacteriota bacterium]|nr:DUF3782 domain-containing protein [Thermodesulfobacteriota bacterium]